MIRSSMTSITYTLGINEVLERLGIYVSDSGRPDVNVTQTGNQVFVNIKMSTGDALVSKGGYDSNLSPTPGNLDGPMHSMD